MDGVSDRSEDFMLDWLSSSDRLPDGPDLELPERAPGREPVILE